MHYESDRGTGPNGDGRLDLKIVNRRANGTPYRRAKGTPCQDGGALM